MKKIGIIGGLGPEATIDYYRSIIELYRKKQKGNFPEIILYSLNMRELFTMLKNNKRTEIINWLVNATQSLQNAGAHFAIIASNTPHIVFDEVRNNSPIPLLSIVEETCEVTAKLGLKRVGLLGTQVTMSADFYQKVFSKRGMTIIVPNKQEQHYIQEKLEREIIFNKILESTRKALLAIIKRMIEVDSIQGVILGCTELPLILTKDEFGIPFLNTTRIHVESAVSYCLR